MKRQLTTCALLLAGLMANAQPLHQPIPNYTNDGTYNRTGTASYFVPSPIGGFMEETLGGVGVDGTTHYLAQNAFISSTDAGIILERKNANNGADLGLVSINIGLQQSQPASTDRCRGLVLNPALNRVYLYGVTSGNAFILCYDMTTLALVPGFGTGGVAIIETGGEATGMVLTGTGNNFLVAINKSGTVILREYTSALAVAVSGTISATSYTYQSSWGSLKKAPNGHYFMAGSSTNTSSVVTPMIWDCIQSSGTYMLSNSTNPTSATLGTGNFVDYDFYINPAPANPATYLFDLVVVGNTPGWTGIYAKYVVSTASGYYLPEPSFKNQTTLPGTAFPSNITVTGGIKFTRCIMAANGYATVLGYFLSSTYSDRAVVGYLTPTGNQYTTTYQAPSPSSAVYARIHKAGAMVKDASGNVLISGCSMGMTYSTIKLSNTYDCRPSFNLKGTSGQICQGESAALNVNISTPNCLITWKTLSPTVSTVYSGMPVSLLVTPNVTTVYECTVINQATGCTSVATVTIQVLPNDPSFSLSINTGNSSYFTMSALANDQTATSSPGFGYAWFVEELDNSNNVIFTFSNPSCWWFALSTPNVFSGIDCVANTYSGASTITNCSVPPNGKFLYGHRYRITRGTWTTACNWRQQSIIVQPSLFAPPTELALQSGESDAADFSYFLNPEQLAPALSLYPNPNNGSFTVETAGQFSSDCYIYDVTGKLVEQISGSNVNRRQIDLNRLKSGVYYLKVAIDGTLTTEKFVVE